MNKKKDIFGKPVATNREIVDGMRELATPEPPSTIGDELDDPLKQQLDRLIIENQSDDGSIDISDQRAMRDEILSLIEQQTKQAAMETLKSLLLPITRNPYPSWWKEHNQLIEKILAEIEAQERRKAA